MTDERTRILAITACPTGIAHTYMAAEKLTDAAHELGHEIKVETHGSIGVENGFTQQDIDAADAVVVASDTQVDLSRFAGMPLVSASVSAGINSPQELIQRALDAPAHQAKDGREATGPVAGGDTLGGNGDGGTSVGTDIYKALMNGVSHMIPFVVAGGLLIAVALSIGGEPTPDGLVVEPGTFWDTVSQVGGIAFSLMVPVLSGYIAYSIADRPGLAPGMITGFIATTGSLYDAETGAGFIGGIITGFMAGYVALAVKKIPVHKYIRPIMPIIVIPVVTTLVVGLVFVYVLGGPIAAAFTNLTQFLEGMQGASTIVLGLILGAMIGFDMGGPVNKTAFLFAGGLIATGNAEPMGMVAAAIAVPPLGMGLASLIRRSTFTSQEQEAGIAALFMGFFGITEGAIPFAAARPLQVIPANVAGAAVGGAVAGVLGATDNVMHGGPIVALLGAVGNPVSFFIALAIGTAVTAAVALGLIGMTGRGRSGGRAGAAAGVAQVAVPGAASVTTGDSQPESSAPAPTSGTAPSEPSAPQEDREGVATATATKARPGTEDDSTSVRSYMSAQTVTLAPSATTRDDLVRELVDLGVATGQVEDPDAVVASALAREAKSSTAVGHGIAIPHAKSDGATEPMVAFARPPQGVAWGDDGGEPAHIVFMISVPEQAAGTQHLKILSSLARALVKESFRTALLAAESPEEIVALTAEHVE